MDTSYLIPHATHANPNELFVLTTAGDALIVDMQILEVEALKQKVIRSVEELRPLAFGTTDGTSWSVNITPQTTMPDIIRIGNLSRTGSELKVKFSC